MNDTLRVSDAPRLQRATSGLVQAGLAAGTPFRLRVATESMLPTVRPGDDLIVAPCDWHDLRAGDIVLCQSGDVLLAHRLVGAQTRAGQVSLITKGDATWNADPPSPLSAYLGKVVRVERAGRSFDLNGRAARIAARYHLTVSLMKVTTIQLYRIMKHHLGVSALLVLAWSLLLVARASAAVTISSFRATGGQGQITVTWTTETEKGNFRFELNRSLDRTSWSKIATVQSQSPCIQSLTTLAYNYTDGNLPSGAKYYYQLKLIGSPCGDPDEIYDQTVSATTSAPSPSPTPTATPTTAPTPQDTPTATPLPTSTNTPPPGATATSAVGLAPTNTPIATNTPSSPDSLPTSTPTNAPIRATATATRGVAPSRPLPANTVAPGAPTTDVSSPTSGPTPSEIVRVAPTEPPAPTPAPAARRPAQTQPTAQPADTTVAVVGVGLVTVIGMGAFGVLALALAGVMLWRYYVRR
ncbi:MAG: hypothetical protein ABI874_02945 [Chloroflexota bacterium]